MERELVLWYGTVDWTTLPSLADCAREAGFDGIAVTPRMHADAVARAGGARELQDQLSDVGVRVEMIDPLVSPLPGTPRPEDVPALFQSFFQFGTNECFQAAHDLGARFVCVAGFLGVPVPQSELLDACGTIAERALAEGLSITLEFIPGTAIHDLAAALRLHREIGLPNVGIMFDTWHFARTGGTLEQLDALPEGVIYGLQLSDRIESEQPPVYVPMDGRLLPGKGNLPLTAWLDSLLSKEPQLHVGVEVFSSAQRSLPIQEAANRATESTRELLMAVADADAVRTPHPARRTLDRG